MSRKKIAEEVMAQMAFRLDANDLYNFRLLALKNGTTTGTILRDFINKLVTNFGEGQEVQGGGEKKGE